MTDTQYDTMRQALKDGVYDAPYSASTLRRLNELNALLDELTDLVETNDILGFVARYQKAERPSYLRASAASCPMHSRSSMKRSCASPSWKT